MKKNEKEMPVYTGTIKSVSAEEHSNTVRIRIKTDNGNAIVLQWL